MDFIGLTIQLLNLVLIIALGIGIYKIWKKIAGNKK
jgi:hypothetical protein